MGLFTPAWTSENNLNVKTTVNKNTDLKVSPKVAEEFSGWVWIERNAADDEQTAGQSQTLLLTVAKGNKTSAFTMLLYGFNLRLTAQHLTNRLETLIK
ncbi:MAG: hypothetical protein LBH04_04400 [Tannerellaceae bacterium]|nr:hypothetical protein [Tannerellaceae bacterium]